MAKNIFRFKLPIRGFCNEPNSAQVEIVIFPTRREMIRAVQSQYPKRKRGAYGKGAFCIRHFNRKHKTVGKLYFSKDNLRAYYIVHELTHLTYHLMTNGHPDGQLLLKNEEDMAMCMDWLFTFILRHISAQSGYSFMVP